MEKHSLFALSKEDFWNRDPCLDFLRKIYLRNWLGVPVTLIERKRKDRRLSGDVKRGGWHSLTMTVTKKRIL
jgi:hypothetical protein